MYTYIGPGLGLGTLAIIIIIGLLLIASLFFVVWIPVKNFFKKRFKKE
jgi:hypothetical protein